MAKAKAKAKSKPARKLPHLLVSFNIMCNSHRHTVGLTPKGQLYLPAHSIKELERELAFRGMGGQACKCADLLRCWREGKFEFDVPQNFLLERTYSSNAEKVARRIQRRIALVRDDSRKALHGAIKGEKAVPEGKGIDEKLAILVCHEMDRRGIKTKRDGARIWCEGVPTPERYSGDPNSLRFSTHGSGYIQVQDGYYNTMATVGETKYEDVPLRQLADILERKMLAYSIVKTDERNLASRKRAFVEKAREILAKFPSKNTSAQLDETQGLVQVTIEFNELTPAATFQMLQAYEAYRGKMIRIKNANAKRNHHPNRFPPAPKKT